MTGYSRSGGSVRGSALMTPEHRALCDTDSLASSNRSPFGAESRCLPRLSALPLQLRRLARGDRRKVIAPH